MVFGIGEGKIELDLSGADFQSGGTVKGKLRLELNKPKKAKELRVELIGEQMRWQTRRGKRQKVKARVYRDMKVLGGEQTYESGEYEFELKAPVKTELEKKAEEGVAGAILGAARMLGAVSPIEYYVVGTLDIPMSIDISKKVQIAII